MKIKIPTTSAFIATLFFSLLSINEVMAAGVIVSWNSIVGRGGEFAHGTYAFPYGFASPEIDDLTSSSIRETGLTIFRYEDALTGFDHLQFTNVPAVQALGFYIEFDVTPKAGIEMDPSLVRMILWRNAGGDSAAAYDVRSSADGYTSVVGTAAWGGAAGSGYTKLEADLSSMDAFTSTTTFRLYLSEWRDNGINPVSSNASWPYGVQLLGETADVAPEPSSAFLLGFGLFALCVSRKR